MQRFMMSVSESMFEDLEHERQLRRLETVQEVIRQIVGDYLRQREPLPQTAVVANVVPIQREPSQQQVQITTESGDVRTVNLPHLIEVNKLEPKSLYRGSVAGGTWTCPKCKTVNSVKNKKCHKCKTPFRDSFWKTK